MGFERIENQRPVKSGGVPSAGLRISARKMAKRKGKPGELARYIKIELGPKLAEKLCLRMDEVALALQFGFGPDAGKIRISVDNDEGGFLARKAKWGSYSLTLNEATCDGLFALEFDAVRIEDLEVKADMGKPPFILIDCPQRMLLED